jgi:hypothetical protein
MHRSCMSEEFFREHPHLQNCKFRPVNTHGKAVNGTKVFTVVIVKLNFRIAGVHMSMNARIVRGLTHSLILGWDVFAKYQAFLHPSKGTLQFLKDKSVPLIEDTHGIYRCYYRVREDLVIPENSKMNTDVELMLDAIALKLATKPQSSLTPAPPMSNRKQAPSWVMLSLQMINPLMQQQKKPKCIVPTESTIQDTSLRKRVRTTRKKRWKIY